MAEKPNTQMCADGKMRGKRPKLKPKKCLTPDCEGIFGAEKKPGARGLCHRCHNAASAMIKRGTTTWAELEELKLAEPRFTNMVERGLVLRRKQKEVAKEINDPTTTTKQEPVDPPAQADGLPVSERPHLEKVPVDDPPPYEYPDW